jgi:hypothetical protein
VRRTRLAVPAADLAPLPIDADLEAGASFTMRRILPDGWPGLVGIGILVGGSALAVGTPRLSEVGGFASSGFFFTNERGPDLGLAIAGVGALN